MMIKKANVHSPVLKVSLTFVSCILIFSLFLKVLVYFEIIQSVKVEWKYLLFLVITCLLIAVFSYWVFTLWGNQLIHYKRISNIRKNIHGINRVSRTSLKEENYFKLMFLDWRMGTEFKKAKNISAGHIKIDTQPVYDYTIYIFRSLMTQLRAGDQYLGLCDLNFWSHVEFGKGFFMSENINAINKGVKIRRLIIINKSILLAPEKHNEKLELMRIVGSLKQWSESFAKEFSLMELHFFLNDDYKIRHNYPTSFALISREGYSDYMEVAPHLNKDGQDDFIDIYFNSTKDSIPYIDKRRKFEEMNKMESKKYTINEMYNILNTDSTGMFFKSA